MKKLNLFFMTVLVLILAACTSQPPKEETEKTEETQTVDQSNSNESTSPEASEGEQSEEEGDTEQTQGSGPSEFYMQLETKISERLQNNYLPPIDYRNDLYDFGILNTAARQYSDIAPMIGSGEMLNSYYEWYDPVNLQEAIVKAYGFTIDFEKYRIANQQEYPEIYYDGDFVYLMSADYPGFNGVEEPIILSIEQFDDQPIYYTELQFRYLSINEYEEAGNEWDPSLWEIPMDEWPEEVKEFIQNNDSTFYAIFIDQGDTFALAYYDSTPLTKDERKSYLENLSSN
ncbi:hypothetical protein UACE39S_05197 [Ureibacillus acetophenoni]